MKTVFRRIGLLIIALLASATSQAQLVIESSTGPITALEISRFKSCMQTFPIPTWGGSNNWVRGCGRSGIRACGIMYEATNDVAILDLMIKFSDACLAARNDLAPSSVGGQARLWTGNIDPVWLFTDRGETPNAGTEQGAVVGHLAYCARLILETPSIWNVTVPIGDPKGYGRTYKERALKYIRECDYAVDSFLLRYFIKASESNHIYYPPAPNTEKPGQISPWNRSGHVLIGLTELVVCHLLLGDDPARIAKYDGVIKPNIDWFKSAWRPNTSRSGTNCVLFGYVGFSGVEDTNHFAYDCESTWEVFNSGRYGLTLDDLKRFANTYFDVVLATTHDGGYYAGRIDGTTTTSDPSSHDYGDKYVRSEYIYLTKYRPDQFERVLNITRTQGRISNSAPEFTARLLAEKQRRYEETTPVAAPTFSPAGGTYTATQFVTLNTATGGAGIRYTLDGSTPSSTMGTLYTGPVTISSSATLKAMAYKSGMSDSSVSSANYVINSGTKQNQTITFPALPSKTVGAADFSPGATASSGLTVSYTSSNPAVATIVNGLIHVVGAGTSTITASQAGNATYNAAAPVSRTLTVGTSVTYYKIKVVNNPNYVLNASATPANGVNVNVYSANGTNNQLWQIVDVGSGYVKIVPRLNAAYCLDCSDTPANGVNVQLWTYSGNTRQQWLRTDLGNGAYKITVRANATY
jgi:hypothetical protein